MELEEYADKEKAECESWLKGLDIEYEFTQLEGEGEIAEILAEVESIHYSTSMIICPTWT
jgi:hypothetical protein